MSLVPASNLSTWRTERGIRPSRTISLRTTGSVDARIAPPINAISQGNPSKRASATAPSPMIIPVPGPNTRAGTSHPLPSSEICNLTASRNSTRARVRVATTSRRGLCGPISIAPRPPLPSKKPRPRNIIGKDSGERSTSPDASAVTVRTMAMTPMINMDSGPPHLVDQAIRIWPTSLVSPSVNNGDSCRRLSLAVFCRPAPGNYSLLGQPGSFSEQNPGDGH